MAKRAAATYVYCLIDSAERPSLTRVPAGLPGTGPVRVLDLGPNETLRLVVADAPLSRYGEEAIQRGLSNLDWVSRAAVAHEAVIEFFIDVDAVLPMKLFTLFTSDERALAHMRADRPRIAALVKWLAKHHEWGVRVVLDRERAVRMPRGAAKTAAGAATGTAYLAHKKAQRDAARERAERARETVAAVYDRLALRARASKRRPAGELPVTGGRLLLDAAFLVPRSRTSSFRALAAREARALAREGYGLTLTGPWPPYTFVQD